MTDVAPARKGPPPRTPGVPAEVSFEAHYRRDTFAGGTPVSGFGLGSALYKPGSTAEEVGERARAFMSAYAAFRGSRS